MAVKFVRKFIKLEASSGIILFFAAVLALIIDNSPWSPYYEQLFQTSFSMHFGPWDFSSNLLHCMNDGLMVLFFLLVGLEIKREILIGELNSWSKIILPAAAALGGMLVPALIYIFINFGDQTALRGWAIPTATDIAFSLGILSLLGSRVPIALKVFLTALAIFDDLGAVIIIALFYNTELSMLAMLTVLFLLFILYILNRAKIAKLAPYLAIGILLWLFVLRSGIHATIAGVLLAIFIPLQIKHGEKTHTPAKYLIEHLHPWVSYLILPLFAFMNAGVSLNDVPPGLSNIFSPVMLGIFLGLIFGKLVGVFGTTILLTRLGLTKMPQHTNLGQFLGISAICGVGFTMSLFVGSLAFPPSIISGYYDAWVRLSVLGGSFISGLLGYIILRLTTTKI